MYLLKCLQVVINLAKKNIRDIHGFSLVPSSRSTYLGRIETITGHQFNIYSIIYLTFLLNFLLFTFRSHLHALLMHLTPSLLALFSIHFMAFALN